ncbi:hypothetical protein [Antrihabitans spumae]|uniref:Secreted protein n=1 Tax=Antrihabitans spumae TaxID=3373370 RepID=A0ABW7JXV4_9NOCA
MNTAQKIAGFTAGLAVVFAAALGTGAVVGPADSPAPVHTRGIHPEELPGEAASPDSAPGGLMVTDSRYTLQLETPQTPTGTAVSLRFRIVDPAGTPLTRYAASHGKQLHLIVVRRDMVGYQHVHPVLDSAGIWSVPLDLTRAGTYRVFADFTPEGGEGVTLGADLHVAGTFDPQPLPAATGTTEIDGYTVTLHGNLVPGQASKVTLSVTKDGRPVTDLQPYLGAYGHLVALRSADLAYLHVHPDGHPGDGVTAAGPTIDFYATAPSVGDYRLFLDFQHAGVVRTAEFTLSAAGSPAEGSLQPEPAVAGHDH